MNEKPRPTTQRRRHLRYGLSVAVAVVAAIGIVILMNWIVDRQYHRLTPQGRQLVRLDLTRTRAYSLSKQTEHVIQRLKGDQYVMVTLLAGKDKQRERVRELVNQYDDWSDSITARHLNPERDMAKVERFYTDLHNRYQPELQPTIRAIEQGLDALERITKVSGELAPPLATATKSEGFLSSRTGQRVELIARALRRLNSKLPDRLKQRRKELARPLPDYGQALRQVRAQLQTLEQQIFPRAAQWFKQAARSDQASAQTTETLLQAAGRLEKLRRQAKSALDQLNSATGSDSYTAVREALLNAEGVVVLGPGEVRMVPLSEMYRAPDRQAVRSAGAQALTFLGEQRLTGALVSMSMKTPPLVVFVSRGRMSALGKRGAYTRMADRLRSMNFEVKQWKPAGPRTMMGRRAPANPPPEPEPGQKAVWIVLPSLASGPRAMMGGNDQRLASRLKKRMAAGDAAFFLLTPSPGASTQQGGTNPLIQLLQGWSIKPQLDRLILREVQLGDRETRATTRMTVTHWPRDHGFPVTQALAGMPALFLQTSPLLINDAPPAPEHDPHADSGRTHPPDSASGDPRYYPLVTLPGEGHWAETDLSSRQSVQEAEFDPEASADHFLIGVAAERGHSRLAVVNGPVWASDRILANVLIRAPGNADLFTNTIYWLSGHEELIATGPGMTNRIQPMSETVLRVYQWTLLAGVPVGVALFGVGVWLVRRRG